MDIVICDDDIYYHQFLSEKLKEYFAEKDIEYNIKHFYSGESLLNSNLVSIDLIFLDIRMNELDGLEVAHILRNKIPDFILIFISSYIEYAPLGYETKALRYMLKEHLNPLFDSMMNSIMKNMGHLQTEIILNFAFGAETIYTEDILYIESRLHTIIFYFNGNKEPRYIYDKLDNIQQLLPYQEFVRIHKSYLVNLKHLIYIKNYIAFLVNDVQLPISQLKFADTKKKFFNYRGTL